MHLSGEGSAANHEEFQSMINKGIAEWLKKVKAETQKIFV